VAKKRLRVAQLIVRGLVHGELKRNRPGESGTGLARGGVGAGTGVGNGSVCTGEFDMVTGSIRPGADEVTGPHVRLDPDWSATGGGPMA
jgi:hypothetical protein